MSPGAVLDALESVLNDAGQPVGIVGSKVVRAVFHGRSRAFDRVELLAAGRYCGDVQA